MSECGPVFWTHIIWFYKGQYVTDEHIFTGYCRQWIMDYASLAAPLQDKSKPSAYTQSLTWSQQADESFSFKLKEALLLAPALGLPDHDQSLYMKNVHNPFSLSAMPLLTDLFLIFRLDWTL